MNTSFDTQTNDFYSQILKKKVLSVRLQKDVALTTEYFYKQYSVIRHVLPGFLQSIFVKLLVYFSFFFGGGVNAFNYPTINYMLLSQPFSTSLSSQKEYIYRQKFTLCLDGRSGLEVACLAMTSAVWVRTQALALIFIILNNLT